MWRLLLVALGLASCTDAYPCVDYCEDVRAEAAALGAELDCDDDKWFRADSCEECEAILADDHGLAPTPGAPCGGHYD